METRLSRMEVRRSFISSDPMENISITVCGDGGTGRFQALPSHWIAHPFRPLCLGFVATTLRLVELLTLYFCLTEGKSSISLRLVRSKWTNEYDPTIQDSYSTTRVVDGRTYQLALTDTAGQEEYGIW